MLQQPCCYLRERLKNYFYNSLVQFTESNIYVLTIYRFSLQKTHFKPILAVQRYRLPGQEKYGREWCLEKKTSWNPRLVQNNRSGQRVSLDL